MTCQICGKPTRTVLVKERNVSCGDYFEGRRLYETDLGNIELVECVECGFGSFDEMNSWPEEKYRNEIYNEAYHLCDTPFREDRPRKLAAWLSRELRPCKLLDYGGGEGRLAELLVESNFDARSYDPFYGDTSLPGGEAEVVTAFEVVEHVPDQRHLFGALKALCARDGIIVFSTLLKITHLAQDWWYGSSRNGHVSFHTADSLRRLMAELGLAYISLSPEIHVAAPQASALIPAKGWSLIPINDTPGFGYIEGWRRMAPIS